MRALSYVLLITGFFYICYCQLVMPALTRAALEHEEARLPKQESYSKEEVMHAMRYAVQGVYLRTPTFIYGAFMMLVGAMILERTKKPMK
jgi:hypothetical protein